MPLIAVGNEKKNGNAIYICWIKDDGQRRISEAAGRPVGYQSLLSGDS